MVDRRSLTQRERADMFLAQGGKCATCPRKLMRGQYHADHRQALVHGGDNDLGNIKLICLDCHKDKTRKDVQGRAHHDRIAVGGKQRVGPKMKSAGFPKGVVVTLPNGMNVRHHVECSCQRCKDHRGAANV